jgi:hypothetical protein
MKYFLLVFIAAFVGCAQLLQGQAQPVKLIGKDNLYFTSCSGMAETMGMCFDKAQTTCNGKYEIIKEYRDSSGVHRELTFQCKK